MMRIIVTILLASLSLVAAGQSRYYPIDPAHSQIKFIGHLGGLMDVEGTFGDFWGYLKYEEDQPEQTSITLIIEPSSIVSGNEWRDKHLKNPDFLDIEKFPRLFFQSRSVAVDGNILQLKGDLELKGEKREIVVPVQLVHPPSPDPWGNRRIGFKSTMGFSRKDLQIGPTEGFWSNSIADEFEMEFVISARQQNMDRMGRLAQSPFKEIYEAAEAGDFKSARAQMTELKEAGNLDTFTANQIALKLDQHDKPAEALKVYELNRELFGDESTTHSNLALAYMDRGDVKKAREFAKKALEMNPKDALAMELLR